MRTHRLAILAILLLAGCDDPVTTDAGPADTGTPDEDAGPEPVDAGSDAGLMDAGPGDAGPPPSRDAGPRSPDAGPRVASSGQLDLLFMVDNSNSMTEEQAQLTAQFPRMVNILSSGDIDQDGRTDGPNDFAPFELHIGVITSDMGTGGFTVPTCANAQFGDDGVLRTTGRTDISGCMATYPSFLAFVPGGLVAPTDYARDVSCVATVGTGGCGFEQQLEATLKALSPTVSQPWTARGYIPPRFFQNSEGNADVENNGFIREGSVLAVVPVTDENDCSARDPELFNPSSATYTADLNLRCFAHEGAALHPISRYVDGLLQLRRGRNLLVYAPIVGIPLDLAPAPGGSVSYPPLISPDPAVRDDRMEEMVDPAQPTQLLPSCLDPGNGRAFPPVRLVQVAEQLEGAGAGVTVGSICGGIPAAVTELIRLAAAAGRP